MVHSPVEAIPFRVPRCLPTVRSCDRTDFPDLFGPFNGIPRTSPVSSRALTRLRSAPRLSQPLSGFSASSSFAALFHPQPFLRLISLQRLSLTRIAHLSRGHLLPCGYSPACWNARLGVLLPSVSPTPALARACLVPPTTMDSLSWRRNTFPGCPGLRAAEPLRSAGFIRFEAFLPL